MNSKSLTKAPFQSITIVGGRNAYLPERFAYKEYWEKKGYICHLANTLGEAEFYKTDILWVLMGFHFYNSKQIKIIHEYQTIPVEDNKVIRYYNSIVKRHFCIRPNLRIFKNEAVKNHFQFKDDVPFIYRDMGISERFFNVRNIEKKYDFVYLGSMSKDRKIEKLLEYFVYNLKDYKLILIGTVPNELSTFLTFPNVFTSGPVNYNNVPDILSQCEYGIHYLPDIFPFTVQTSTKLLEYSAAGLKIISTRIKFLEEFLDKYGGSVYKFDANFSDFNINDLLSFHYSSPNVQSLKWSELLDKSDILSKVNQLFYNPL